MSEENQIQPEDIKRFRKLFRQRQKLEDEYSERWEEMEKEIRSESIDLFVEKLGTDEEYSWIEPTLRFSGAKDKNDYLMNRKSLGKVQGQIDAILDRLDYLIYEEPIHVLGEDADIGWFEQLRKERAIGDLSDCFFELFDERYKPRDYVRRKESLAVRVTFSTVSSSVVDLLKEAREAFCLGLAASCISLCRSSLESAVIDVLHRSEPTRGRQGSDTRTFRMKLEAALPGHIRLVQKTMKIYQAASDVIHSHVKASDKSAQSMLEVTQDCIKDIYNRYPPRNVIGW